MPHTIQATVIDAPVQLVSRQMTPEGFLRATAAIMKTGVLQYNTGELGIEGPPRIVGVYRDADTVFANETRESLKGKPVTNGHPPPGVLIGPGNFREMAVGSLGDDPAPLDAERLGVSLTLYDAAAISQVQGGKDQVSAGYGFELVADRGRIGDERYDYRVVGPALINHLALVPKGRAGHSVRIQDQGSRTMAEGNEGKDGGDKGQEAMKTTVADAIKESLGDLGDTITEAVTAGITAAFKAQADAEGAEGDEGGGKEKKATQAQDEGGKGQGGGEGGKEKPDASPEAIQAQARDRAALIDQCRPLLPEDFDPHDHDAKAILVKAVGDAVADADKKSEDYLRGVVSSLGRDRARAETRRRQINDGQKGGGAGGTGSPTAPRSIHGLRAMRAAKGGGS